CSPVNFQDSADLFAIVELDPIAHLEWLLRLNGQTGKQVSQCILKRKAYYRRQQRRGREQGAGFDSGSAQHKDSYQGVYERLDDIFEDLGGWPRPASGPQRIDYQQEAGTADAREQHELGCKVMKVSPKEAIRDEGVEHHQT